MTYTHAAVGPGRRTCVVRLQPGACGRGGRHATPPRAAAAISHRLTTAQVGEQQREDSLQGGKGSCMHGLRPFGCLIAGFAEVLFGLFSFPVQNSLDRSGDRPASCSRHSVGEKKLRSRYEAVRGQSKKKFLSLSLSPRAQIEDTWIHVVACLGTTEYLKLKWPNGVRG